MRFDIATLAIALLALLTVPIFARPISTYEVAPAIRELTTIVKTLQKHSHSITLFNAPFIMISQGPFPHILKGLDRINTKCIRLNKALHGRLMMTSPVGVKAIVKSYTELARDIDTLTHILIVKAMLFRVVPQIGTPMYMALAYTRDNLDELGTNLLVVGRLFEPHIGTQRNLAYLKLSTAMAAYKALIVEDQIPIHRRPVSFWKPPPVVKLPPMPEPEFGYGPICSRLGC